MIKKTDNTITKKTRQYNDKKNRQYNDQKKKGKKTNNGRQNTTHKTK
jgi:hypothetical protein